MAAAVRCFAMGDPCWLEIGAAVKQHGVPEADSGAMRLTRPLIQPAAGCRQSSLLSRAPAVSVPTEPRLVPLVPFLNDPDATQRRDCSDPAMNPTHVLGDCVGLCYSPCGSCWCRAGEAAVGDHFVAAQLFAGRALRLS